MKFLKKHISGIIFGFIVIVCFIVVIDLVMIIGQYSASIKEQALEKADYYTDGITLPLINKLDTYSSRSSMLAVGAENIGDKAEFLSYIGSAVHTDGFEDVFGVYYSKNGVLYDENGSEAEQYPGDLLSLSGDRTVVSRSYNSLDQSGILFGVYSPVYDCEFADAIYLIYQASVLGSVDLDESSNAVSMSSLAAVCSADGTIINILHSDDSGLETRQNVFDKLREITNDKSLVDDIKADISAGRDASCTLTIDGIDYAFTAGGCGENNGGYYMMSLYDFNEVYSEGYGYVSVILGFMAVLVVLIVGFCIYYFVSGAKMRREIYTISTTDPMFGCSTPVGFQNSVTEILERNKGTRFAVVVAHTNYLNYLIDKMSESGTNEVLRSLCDIYKKSLQRDETVAYYSEGDFALLLHYRDREALIARLKAMTGVIRHYSSAKSKQFNITVVFGIYEVDRADSLSAQKMVDVALAAKNITSNNDVDNIYRFYDVSAKDRTMKKADVEARMVSALENEEFKLFYQPKYNIDRDTVDGCEVLVRWYDPYEEAYRLPGEFMPIFEQNGFIIKVDHFVLENACKNLAKEMEAGGKIHPVSVNVSRLTAIQEDFLDFYISTKKKYGIRDKYITVEFTESFAFENYEYLVDVINTLHKNGFGCSVDDFGTGYSSYNILKALQMDEIKLDKMFIEKGISEERDRLILENVIDIVKKLKMKVTQEGVETLEDFDRLRKLGCDVIQGFYYSVPLPYKEYRKFVQERATSSYNPTYNPDKNR